MTRESHRHDQFRRGRAHRGPPVGPAVRRGRHAVVVPDLRGYGASDKPTEAGGTMAADIVRVMQQLGHERFAIMGHDRGVLVAVRAELDHPDRISHLGILDVLPTLDTWDVLHGVDAKVAWHLYLRPSRRGCRSA